MAAVRRVRARDLGAGPQALLEFHRKHSEPKSPPNLKPLAVIPSGLPIRDIVQRLEELQAQYPDATVK